MRKILVFVCGLMMLLTNKVLAADENLEMFVSALENSHIMHVDMPKLTMAAFQGLKDMDPKINIANDKSRFTFYYDTKVYKNFNKPDPENVKEWLELIDKVTKAAIEISPNMALKDFEIPDAIMSRMAETLDEDSKFYRSMDLVDKSAIKRKLNFATREIGEILYVRIGTFNVKTPEQMAELLQNEKKAKAMIIDLRGNSGGQLSAAAKVGSMFLEEGIVFLTRGHGEDANVLYPADPEDMFAEKPIAILVDGNTASAAELFAASLQEQSRAVLLGTETYGKGTTQRLVTLPNGSVLAVTNAAIYAPSGMSFRERGVQPDYCLSGKNNRQENLESLKIDNVKTCKQQNREGLDVDVELARRLLESRI